MSAGDVLEECCEMRKGGRELYPLPSSSNVVMIQVEKEGGQKRAGVYFNIITH
jgi:hypothetical protein